ncbi:MAG TPA: histidinol-phosphate transaminase [Tepidisphaeraceae bacterium]|jgi:histidinol-phosphate aminotransferase|nr:histidinol-phosphate transaminase [Tepidisphaeraceae bacterium]
MALTFIRANVREMAGYTPGEQPSPGERIIKLNTNENPFPPSEKVIQAIREVEAEMLRRYPNPTADAFRAAAAKHLGVTMDMLLAGNGSDDLLTIATRTCVRPGGVLAAPQPTYSLYPVLAKLEDAKFAPVPWEANWSLPIDGLLATKADAIYMANPNAPSGTWVEPAKLAELAGKFPGLLLIDEAYVDFADGNSLPLVREHENVVITRTFSKAYSLAGLRFGYAIGQKPVIAEMMKVKDSYNCDALSVAAATAALQDQVYAQRCWRDIRAERQRLSDALSAMGFVVPASRANFILATCPGGRGQETYLGLKRQGILVRYFNLPGLTDKIRITIGTSQENNGLIAGIKMLTATERAA